MSENRYALLIGSTTYEDKGLQKLAASSMDVKKLSAILEDTAIGNFNVKMLVDKPSYLLNKEIEVFFKKRTPEDLLLLYFSGHGIKDPNGHLYFATKDTERDLLKSSAVSANWINEVMNGSRSKRQVLLLDCCYGGAFAKGMIFKADDTVNINENFAGKGRVILTASNAMQYAFIEDEDTIKGGDICSVFTEKIINGLESGKADRNGDGKITIHELYDYVYDELALSRSPQKPQRWDFGVQGDILIANNPNPEKKTLPDEIQHALGSPLAEVRVVAVNGLERLLKSNDVGLALAAKEALVKLREDDSRRVSTLVATILDKNILDIVESDSKSYEDDISEEIPVSKREVPVEKELSADSTLKTDLQDADKVSAEPVTQQQKNIMPDKKKQIINLFVCHDYFLSKLVIVYYVLAQILSMLV